MKEGLNEPRFISARRCENSKPCTEHLDTLYFYRQMTAVTADEKRTVQTMTAREWCMHPNQID